MKKQENVIYDLKKFEKTNHDEPTLKVLVVDDNQVLTLLMSRLLEGMGCTTEMAHNGLDASFEMLKQDFDLLVIDWDMPLRGGRWTLQQVDDWVEKSKGEINPNLRFVLYTGMDPETIDLPHTKHLKFLDFWKKEEGVEVIQKKAQNLIQRINKDAA